MGGAEITHEHITVIGHNIRGFPSDKANIHKLKGVRDMMINQEGMIVLETGTN